LHRKWGSVPEEEPDPQITQIPQISVLMISLAFTLCAMRNALSGSWTLNTEP